MFFNDFIQVGYAASKQVMPSFSPFSLNIICYVGVARFILFSAHHYSFLSLKHFHAIPLSVPMWENSGTVVQFIAELYFPSFNSDCEI